MAKKLLLIIVLSHWFSGYGQSPTKELCTKVLNLVGADTTNPWMDSWDHHKAFHLCRTVEGLFIPYYMESTVREMHYDLDSLNHGDCKCTTLPPLKHPLLKSEADFIISFSCIKKGLMVVTIRRKEPSLPSRTGKSCYSCQIMHGRIERGTDIIMLVKGNDIIKYKLIPYIKND